MKKVETIKTDEVVKIPPIETQRVSITLEGMSPLLVHQFGEKSKRQIEEKQQKIAKGGRAARDPDAEFRSSLYTISGGKKPVYGVPASGIKNCAVSACRFIEGVSMTTAKGAFHILAPEDGLIPIKGPAPVMDARPVRIGGFGKKVADMRYRGRFDKWEVSFDVIYNKRVISPEQLVNLYENAGFAIGLHEYRPEKGGNLGMFHVKRG